MESKTIIVREKILTTTETSYHVNYSTENDLKAVIEKLAEGKGDEINRMKSTDPDGYVGVRFRDHMECSSETCPEGLLGPEPTMEIIIDDKTVFENGLKQ